MRLWDGVSTPILSWDLQAGLCSSRRQALLAQYISGTGITPAQPGSAQGLYLVVSDIEAARNSLIERGAKVTELLHRVSGALIPGAAAERQSYGSYATFNDPDGNGWLLPEVTVRLPGRIDSGATSYGSQSDLASALRRAADAHGAHEKETGQRDTDWAAWYAQYLAERTDGCTDFTSQLADDDAR